MSEHGGGEGPDRPRWEGFPGGVEPDQYAAGPGTPGYTPPVPPRFPVDPGPEITEPIPIVSAIGAEFGAEAAAPPPAGGGRHGAAAPRRALSRYVALGCAAAVLVIGGAFGFAACNGNNSGTSAGGTAPIVPVAPSVSTTPTPSVSPAATGSASSTPTAKASSTASASTSAGPTTSPTASSTPTSSATAAAAKQPVVVLNSTAIAGLAKRTATKVEAKGWTVTKTTNWKGAKPASTTIYYRPGAANKASAELFARQFPFVVHVRPALPGMTSGLTLVVAADAA